jgi:hypothetical protein
MPKLLPVDENPTRRTVDDVPRCQVVVAEDLVRTCRVTASIRPSKPPRFEVGNGVVIAARQSGDRPKRRVVSDQVEVVRPDHDTLDVREDLTPIVVDPENAGCAAEPAPLQVPKQRVDTRGPGPSRTAHGGADSHYSLVGVATRERLSSFAGLGHVAGQYRRRECVVWSARLDPAVRQEAARPAYALCSLNWSDLLDSLLRASVVFQL